MERGPLVAISPGGNDLRPFDITQIGLAAPVRECVSGGGDAPEFSGYPS